MAKLTPAERETVVRYDMEEKILHVSTNIPKDINKCKKLVESDANWQLIGETDGTYSFTGPLKGMLLKATPKKRELTEEQRRGYSERAKQNLVRKK